MLMLDKTSERLRSKHVRTLELLQKTLDENGELRDRISQLQKGTLHLSQNEPPSNRINELEDEIDRLKAEHYAKFMATEEAARVRRDELQKSIDALQTKQQRLQNDITGLETKLRGARDALQNERTEWQRERQSLMQANQSLRREVERLQSDSDAAAKEQRHAAAVTALQQEVDVQRQRQLDSDSQNGRLRDEVAALTTELDLQKLFVATQQHELETTRQQITELHAQEIMLNGLVEASRAQIHNLETTIHDLETTVEKLQHEYETATTRLTQATQNHLQQHHQDFATTLAQLHDMEEQNQRLVSENRALHDSLTKLQTHHAELARANSANGSAFATHIDLKRENFHLRAQIDELKALQRRFLTTATKKTMNFPAI